MRPPVVFLHSALAFVASLACAEESKAPVEIAAGAPQLFVDDFLIASSTGLKRTLHQPKKDDGGQKPLLAIENEFDGQPGMLHANGTILFDPKLNKWVMFARGTSHDAPI